MNNIMIMLGNVIYDTQFDNDLASILIDAVLRQSHSQQIVHALQIQGGGFTRWIV